MSRIKNSIGEQAAYPEGYPDDFQGDLEREERRKNDAFSLDRTPAKPAPPAAEIIPPARQAVLFSGLGCMAGQKDLFPTDGNFSE